MKVFTIKGSNYECGYELGKRFSRLIKIRLHLFKLTDSLVKRTDLDETNRLCNRFYPEYVKELEGMAQGANVDYWKLFFLNCTELLPTNRCSSIAIKEPDKLIMAHNEDADNFEKKSYFSIVKFIQPKISFYSFMYPGELPGSAYAWNSEGLIITINNLRNVNPDLTKLPRNFIARALIDTKTTEEALTILKKNECTSGYHYLIAQKNKIFSVEQYHGEISVKEVNGSYAHTNHYIQEKFWNMPESTNSKIRLKQINKLIAEKKDYLDILFDKENRPNPIFNRSNDKNRTVSTFVVDLMNNKIRVYTKDSRKKFVEFKIKE